MYLDASPYGNINIVILAQTTLPTAADSPLRPAAPQSCPPQTWVAQRAPQAEPQLSPSSAGSSPATQSADMSRCSTFHSRLYSLANPVCGQRNSCDNCPQNTWATHIFQLNVSPLIILKLGEHILGKDKKVTIGTTVKLCLCCFEILNSG